MEWVETIGKTVEEAVESALEQLGVAEKDAEIVVVEEPRSGMFGLRRSSARIRAWVRPVQPRAKRPSHRSRAGASGGPERGSRRQAGRPDGARRTPAAKAEGEERRQKGAAAQTGTARGQARQSEGPAQNGSRNGGGNGSGEAKDSAAEAGGTRGRGVREGGDGVVVIGPATARSQRRRELRAAPSVGLHHQRRRK